jgi:hypothetical protein
MVIARTAVRESTEMLQDKPLKHRARPAKLANTGWELETLRYRARLAVRASTGILQDKPLNHRARAVPRTHRAVLHPPVFVTQDTVATPEQEYAQRA